MRLCSGRQAPRTFLTNNSKMSDAKGPSIDPIPKPLSKLLITSKGRLINAKIVAWLKKKKESADVGAFDLDMMPFSFLEKGEVSNHLRAMVADEQTGGSCSHGHSRPAPREGRVTQTRKHI